MKQNIDQIVSYLEDHEARFYLRKMAKRFPGVFGKMMEEERVASEERNLKNSFLTPREKQEIAFARFLEDESLKKLCVERANELLGLDRKIPAIKRVMDTAGIGLRNAKEWVESLPAHEEYLERRSHYE